VPQTVEVRPADDVVVDLLRPCTVTTAVTSPDPVYADLGRAPAFAGTPAGITAQVQDYAPPAVTDDPPFALVTTSGGNGAEVGEAAPRTADTVSVVLDRAPRGADVTVTVAAAADPLIAGPQLTVSGPGGAAGPSTTLTFTPANWNIAQAVSVLAVDDDYDEDEDHRWALSVSMASTAPGFADPLLRRVVVDRVPTAGSATVGVVIADDDTSAVLAGPPTGRPGSPRAGPATPSGSGSRRTPTPTWP
jgi:hypothetical protein